MYVRTIIEPEWDESFRWSPAPELPRMIIGGLGLVDANGVPVEVFRGATEQEAWRAAFAASTCWTNFEEFCEEVSLEGHYPRPWNAVCPGRIEPARWFMLVMPRTLLSEIEVSSTA